MAPVLVVPALATTATGSRPARRSSSSARRRSATSMRPSASQAIGRTARRPRPSTPAARWIVWCASRVA